MTNPTLSEMHHATRTIQDIYDEMSPEQKDTVDLIIGASLEGLDLEGDAEVVAAYDGLTREQQAFIHFVVGNAPNSEAIEQSDLGNSDSLAHFGVKGMRWGVRRDDSGGGSTGGSKVKLVDTISKNQRAELRAKVKAGSGTLGDAHLAALKTKGHRVTNALLGDKTYWKRQAVIAGALAVGTGIALAAPAVMPAATLAAIGSYAYGTAGLGLSAASNAALGSSLVTNLIATGTGSAAGVASNVVGVTNLLRAVRGNARIEKSYHTLGKNLRDAQTKGSEKVQKTLNRSGSIRNKVLHSDPTMSEALDEFFAHFGTKGMKWGVRKDLIGATDLGPSGGGGVLAKPGTKPPTNEEVRRAGMGTSYVRSAMMDKTTGVGRPGGELQKLNAKHAGKDIVGNAEHKRAYKEEMSAVLTKFAQANAPKGADARVFVGENSVLLVMGDKDTIDQFAKDALTHADSGLDKIEIKIVRDENGFIIGFEEDLEQADILNDFLEHHGIKGMRWGVRRTDKQLGNTPSGSNKDLDSDGVSRIAPDHTGGTGNPHLSADAERAINIMSKPTSQMSDRELKDATNRAKQLAEYNKVFGGGEKSPLERQVEQMRLQKDYLQLKRELTPERRTAAQKFISTAGAGFNAYRQIDSVLGGNLSKSLTRKLGLDVPMSLKEKIAVDNEIKKLKKINVKNTAELNEAIELYGKVARGDAPSLAKGYKGAGKRKATGPRRASDDNAPYAFPS